MADFRALDQSLDVIPGTVSVWCGALGSTSPEYARRADEPHYAASLMKLAVLVALHRLAERGLDLDRDVLVHNDFASAIAGAPRFGLERRHDPDDDVWQRRTATPRWLADRMITRSSNLAANVLLELVGVPAADEVWRSTGSRVGRAIGDTAAADAGITNLVTATDLARLLTMIAADDKTEMLNTLLGQRRTEDLAAGLPAGTRVAHKNGWVMGVRHSAGVIYPDDAPPIVLAVCLTTPLAVNRGNDKACQIVSWVASIAWQQRHELAVNG